MRSKTQIYTIYAMLSVITCATVALFLMSVFQCKPINHFVRYLPLTHTDSHTNATQWYHESPGTCLGPEITLSMAYLHASIIASSDFAFTLLPIFVVGYEMYCRASMKLTGQGGQPSNGSVHKDIGLQPDGSRRSVSLSPPHRTYPHSPLPVQASLPSCESRISRIWSAQPTFSVSHSQLPASNNPS